MRFRRDALVRDGWITCSALSLVHAAVPSRVTVAVVRTLGARPLTCTRPAPRHRLNGLSSDCESEKMRHLGLWRSW